MPLGFAETATASSTTTGADGAGGPTFTREELAAWIAQYAPPEYGTMFVKHMTTELWPYCFTGRYATPQEAFRARTY